MDLAQWDGKYETGFLAVDTQHKHLFSLVNGLHDALIAGAGKEGLGSTIGEFEKYTVEHFRTEEQLMVRTGYPRFKEHMLKHREMQDQVRQLVSDFEAGRITLQLTLARFLVDWIRHHIDEEDRAMADWLKGRA